MSLREDFAPVVEGERISCYKCRQKMAGQPWRMYRYEVGGEKHWWPIHEQCPQRVKR